MLVIKLDILRYVVSKRGNQYGVSLWSRNSYDLRPFDPKLIIWLCVSLKILPFTFGFTGIRFHSLFRSSRRQTDRQTGTVEQLACRRNKFY